MTGGLARGLLGLTPSSLRERCAIAYTCSSSKLTLMLSLDWSLLPWIVCAVSLLHHHVQLLTRTDASA